ncbi:MAG: thymidine phosphorylase [Candidatus Cloacimonadota bacterium]|nr:thymidine phosphorylase [Candidatus Cloacimonadota bacterium]
MNPVELIIKKRDGKKLDAKELKEFVVKYLEGQIPEYQMSALLMAIFFQDMKANEVHTLTKIYIESGKQLNFPQKWHTVDKHSTGGVGDKISLALAPIAAACGCKIPMISGRGLGHTGGTLDKLESIPGFKTSYNDEVFKKLIEKNGFAIISQSQQLVPADKRIYALRDVTGTVESLPLITASIMSKKIAEGAQNLVIDLKVGSGAFIKEIRTAKKLASLLKSTGESLGQQVKVIFSNMNAPLGNYIGNALEVLESINYLKGEKILDIDEIIRALAIQMLNLADIEKDATKAEKMITNVIENGTALKYFEKFVRAQGGDANVCNDSSILPQAKFKIAVKSRKTGYIKSVNSQAIGYAMIELNAGRKTLDSKLDHATGAYLPFKIGDKIEKGQNIGTVYANEEGSGHKVADMLAGHYEIIDEPVEKQKIIID